MSDPTVAAPPPPSPLPSPKQENPLTNLLLNVLLPVVILSYCSKERGTNAPFYAMGPVLALIVAVSLPVGYQIYDFVRRRKWNLFSIIGMISVLLTGGLGLLTMNAQAFAWKEASIPLVLAALIYLSDRTPKPLVRTLLLNPDIMDVPRIEREVAERSERPAFDRLMRTSTLLLTATMLLSAALNYSLALYLISGTEHDKEKYNQAIGKMMGWGFLIIGVPTMLMLIFALFRLFKGLKRITGLPTDQLLLPR